VRASRLLSALLLLQSRGRVSARVLAAELGVSVRTVYRDMDALHAAGIPVYAGSGPDGGYQLVEGFRTRLTGLTEAEAQALFLTGLPGPAAELGLGALLSAVELKLAAALPAPLRNSAQQVRDRFHLDAPGWYQAADSCPHLGTIADAVWHQRVLRLRYLRWKAPADVIRVVRPYGLVLKAGAWYLVARPTDSAGPRTFKVNKVRDCQVLEDRFDRPPDFDLAAYWQRYLAEFQARLHKGNAVVRFSPRARERLPDLVGADVRAAVADTSSAPDPAGWVTATVPIESLTHAESQFLRFGAEVEILQPASLRRRMAQIARALGERYR
jgi:predicted DNA-binding transcriptional regulator YafY